MDIKITIPDEKKNDLALKRMDNLERKLDAQYKSFIDKTDYIKVIEDLQKSFMNNLNRMMVMHKSMMTQTHQDKFDVLRSEFAKKIKTLQEDKDNNNLKYFSDKLNSLEDAIKNITLKPSVIKVTNNNDKTLFNSFDGILHKLENLIRESRPRLIPSPS